ncbi:uncharacterized protein [Battus philenor]|uniref:uncharacterized protein n=1 Tax=Battus philenor TaxID=42288 RepID=UPI0035D08557
MSVVRTCLYSLVILVNFHLAIGKPFGGFIWCDLFCDDDDNVSTSSTSTSTEDYDFFDVCGGCPTRRPSTRRPINNLPPLNFEIPPNTGMGVTVSNRNGSWFMNLSPWASRFPSTALPPLAATTPAATTAGTGGTTVASTTAKK